MSHDVGIVACTERRSRGRWVRCRALVFWAVVAGCCIWIGQAQGQSVLPTITNQNAEALIGTFTEGGTVETGELVPGSCVSGERQYILDWFVDGMATDAAECRAQLVAAIEGNTEAQGGFFGNQLVGPVGMAGLETLLPALVFWLPLGDGSICRAGRVQGETATVTLDFEECTEDVDTREIIVTPDSEGTGLHEIRLLVAPGLLALVGTVLVWAAYLLVRRIIRHASGADPDPGVPMDTERERYLEASLDSEAVQGEWYREALPKPVGLGGEPHQDLWAGMDDPRG